LAHPPKGFRGKEINNMTFGWLAVVLANSLISIEADPLAATSRWPEWADELAAILEGQGMQAGKGWWRPSDSLHGWEWLRDHFDSNRDGRVEPGELAARFEDFDRLDRDGDGAITPGDLGPSPPLGVPPLVDGLFQRLDADGNDRLSWDELSWFFQQSDRRKRGFLDRQDLAASLATLASSLKDQAPDGARVRRGGGDHEYSRLRLLEVFSTGQLGSFAEGPALGAQAPDFSLSSLDGRRVAGLAAARGKRPVVLIFGNFTCGNFRGQLGPLEELRRRYAPRADFYMVYTRESHPADGWRLASNDRAGVIINQPRTAREREMASRRLCQATPASIPVLLDRMDNAMTEAYAAFPDRLYLIDRRGRVVYKGGRGPVGFDPRSLEEALVLTLLAEGGVDEGKPLR
jgi:Ca2+-binding EF-hand superfamily protein